VLAYVFWHRPRPDADVEAYEQALVAFQHSLAHSPPVGLRANATFRVAELPWLQGSPGYEDWYVLDDFSALGVLGEAAVGRGHRSRHDRAARHMGAAAGGLYRLLEGCERPGRGAGEPAPATWVAPAPGADRPVLGELLADGADPARAGLWRRQLVLGPAPEYCLLAPEPASGVAPSRLPPGWSAQTLTRVAIFDG
jgi:hypothetical protein